jgi:hypothetical protein
VAVTAICGEVNKGQVALVVSETGTPQMLFARAVKLLVVEQVLVGTV